LRLLNSGECAVALLEASPGDGVLSLLAAAIAALIIEHVISCHQCSSVDLLSAVAREDSLAVKHGVNTAATYRVSNWEGQSLAGAHRRVGGATNAVLRVNSLSIGLVDARALLAHSKCNGRGLV